MPSYKITYFAGRGRAECSRLMLVAAGQKFEDVRVERPDWPVLKATLPGLAQLPILEIDGKTLTQSGAMESFFAREYGYYGASNWESAQVAEIVAIIHDLWDGLVKIIMESDESKKLTMKKTYFEETAPKFLKVLDDFLKRNNGGNGFFVGKKMSLADISFHTTVDTFDAMDYAGDKGLDKFPKLLAVKSRVSADKNIAAYLSGRPFSPI